MGGFDLLEDAQSVSDDDPLRFSLLPTKGMRVCSRMFVPGQDGDEPLAKLWHRVDGAGKVRGTVTGLLRCGSMLCPVCGSARRRQAAELLQGSAEKWMERGGRLAFVTFTVRHLKGDSAADVLAWVHGGWRQLGKSRRVRARTHGFWRAMEWNYSERNGHHLHIHAVAFLRDDVTMEELEDELFAAWEKGVGDAGGRSLSRAAFDVRPVSAARELASYCNKVAHSAAGGMASEAARADEKVARVGSRSVMQLLADGASALIRADSQHVKLSLDERHNLRRQGRRDAHVFHEIVATMRNKSWIHKPKAKELRELFGEVADELDAEKCDGSDEAMKAKGWVLVRCLNAHQLSTVRRVFGISSLIAALLTARTAGDAAMAIHGLLAEAFASGTPPPPGAEQLVLAA